MMSNIAREGPQVPIANGNGLHRQQDLLDGGR